MRDHEEGDAIRQPSHLLAVSWPTWWGMGAITSVRHVISAGRRRAHCAPSCRNYPGVRFDESCEVEIAAANRWYHKLPVLLSSKMALHIFRRIWIISN
ncbi:hypothetical protein B296_00002919 [Ensete ventricosum]|uniref:Uncharacterized protein n=1 Tax=Ensete ventricosum TaxID=4639 RepID=A0A426Z9Z7_ENSVE|nr:hypothetical protein B296_00002919 [Ensete ventricosum]